MMKVPAYEKTILRNRAFDRMVETAKGQSQQQAAQPKPMPARISQQSGSGAAGR
jgi:hypothetical protein